MIPKFLMIPRETEHIVDPQGSCPQDVTLNRYPVTIPTDHLEDGVKSHLLEDDTRRKGTHPHHRGLIVRHIDRIHHPLEQSPFLP